MGEVRRMEAEGLFTFESSVDLFTAVGVLVLAHTDGQQLQADLAEVRRMEAEGLFTFESSVERMDAASPVGHRSTSRSAELEKESAGKNSEGSTTATVARAALRAGA